MTKFGDFRAAQHESETLTALQIFINGKDDEGCSPYTLIHYFYSLEPLLNQLPHQFNQITKKKLNAYANQLKRTRAAGTVRPAIGDIKTFFKWAKKNGYIPKNIAKNLTKPKPRPQHPKAAPEPHIAAVISHLEQQLHDHLYYDLFTNLKASNNQNWHYLIYKQLHDLFTIMFLYETGCRAGELTNLTTKQLNHITAAQQSVYLITLYGKTGHRRYRFTNTTADLWRIWWQKRPFTAKTAVVSWKKSQQPQPAKTGGISQMIARRCQQANVPPFRAHALRHAHVKRTRQQFGLQIASQLVDHSNITTTQQYANINDDELSAAAAAIGWQRKLFE